MNNFLQKASHIAKQQKPLRGNNDSSLQKAVKAVKSCEREEIPRIQTGDFQEGC